MDNRIFQTALRAAFVASVWLTIAYGALGITMNILRAESIFSLWGPFAMRVFLAPAGLAGMQLIWWFTVYRPHGLEGRPVMIMMGIVFLMVLLIMRLNEGMHGMAPGALNYLFFSCVALAHLAYGILGRQARRSGRELPWL